MIRGSRVSFRLGIPDSKTHFISYNYELNSIYEMVAHHIEKEFALSDCARAEQRNAFTGLRLGCKAC